MAPGCRGCVNCKQRLRPNEITYNVTDLESDTIKIVEETIGREAKVYDCLCSICFTTVIQPSNEHRETVVAMTDPLYDAQETEIKQYISSEEDEVEEINETEVEEADIKEIEVEVAKIKKQEEDEPEEVNLQSKNCVVCSEILTEQQSFPLAIGPERDVVENQIFPKKLSRHSVICKGCLTASRRGICRTEKPSASTKIEPEESTKPTPTVQDEADALVYVPNYYMARGGKKCFVKNCTSTECRKTIPSDLRRILLENYNLFLSSGCRVCLEHRKEYYKDWNCIIDKKLYPQKFTSAEVEEMLELLRCDNNMTDRDSDIKIRSGFNTYHM